MRVISVGEPLPNHVVKAGQDGHPPRREGTTPHSVGASRALSRSATLRRGLSTLTTPLLRWTPSTLSSRAPRTPCSRLRPPNSSSIRRGYHPTRHSNIRRGYHPTRHSRSSRTNKSYKDTYCRGNRTYNSSSTHTRRRGIPDSSHLLPRPRLVLPCLPCLPCLPEPTPHGTWDSISEPFKAAIGGNWAFIVNSAAEIDAQGSARRHADIAALREPSHQRCLRGVSNSTSRPNSPRRESRRRSSSAPLARPRS